MGLHTTEADVHAVSSLSLANNVTYKHIHRDFPMDINSCYKISF